MAIYETQIGGSTYEIDVPEGQDPGAYLAQAAQSLGQDQAQPAQPPQRPATTPTTPGETLRSENNPISKGVRSMSDEAFGGLKKAISLNPLNIGMGALQFLGSPSVGAGEAAGTTAHNVLSNIPGLGGPEGVIPAGGAALTNAAIQLLGGGPLLRGMTSALKAGSRGLAQIVAPGAVREAGAQQAAKIAGMKPEMVEQAFSTPASKALYDQAGQVGTLPSQPIEAALLSAYDKIDKLGALRPVDKKTVTNILNGVYNRVAGGKMTYGDMVDELQALRGHADSFINSAIGGKTVVGQQLSKARAEIMNAMDEVSPVLRNANNAYRREETAKAIVNAMRTGNPGSTLRNLVLDDPSIAKAFGEKAMKEIETIADRISRVASTTPAGGWRTTMGGITETLAEALTNQRGRAFLGTLLQSTSKQTGQNLFAALQAWKAANALQDSGNEGASY